jgi:hypothetical protein
MAVSCQLFVASASLREPLFQGDPALMDIAV